MLTHFYAWKNNEKRVTMYRRECRVLVRGAMNSILIEFANGQRECVSRNSARRLSLVRRHAEKVGNVINFDEYKHEWKFDLPWHMVNLKDWFYMVNVGHFGDVFLHVRIFGVRSLWTFPEPESRRTQRAGGRVGNCPPYRDVQIIEKEGIMADCKSCHWAGVDWADNVVCGCPAETNPDGDCSEYEMDDGDDIAEHPLAQTGG